MRAGPHQEQGGVHDFLHRGQPLDGVQTLEEFVVLGLVHGRVHDAGGDGVYADACGRVLDRQAAGDCVQAALGQAGQRGVDSRDRRRQPGA